MLDIKQEVVEGKQQVENPEVEDYEIYQKQQYLQKINFLQKIPFMDKVSEVIDNQIENGKNLILPYKNKFCEKKTKLSVNISKAYSNNFVTRKLDSASKAVLKSLEEQINQIAQSFNVKNGIFVAEQQSQLDIKKRSKQLLSGINQVTNIMADYYADYFQSFGCVQLADRSFLEMKVFLMVCADIARDIVKGTYLNVIQPIGKKLIIEPISKIIETCQSAKEKIIVDIKKLKENKFTVVKSLWEKTCKQTDILKEATVHFYENYISIEFAKNFFDQNKELIIKSVKRFYTSLQNHMKESLNSLKCIKKMKTNSVDLYQKVLKDYQQRRLDKLKKMLPKSQQLQIEADNEKKLQ